MPKTNPSKLILVNCNLCKKFKNGTFDKLKKHFRYNHPFDSFKNKSNYRIINISKSKSIPNYVKIVIKCCGIIIIQYCQRIDQFNLFKSLSMNLFEFEDNNLKYNLFKTSLPEYIKYHCFNECEKIFGKNIGYIAKYRYDKDDEYHDCPIPDIIHHKPLSLTLFQNKINNNNNNLSIIMSIINNNFTKKNEFYYENNVYKREHDVIDYDINFQEFFSRKLYDIVNISYNQNDKTNILYDNDKIIKFDILDYEQIGFKTNKDKYQNMLIDMEYWSYTIKISQNIENNYYGLFEILKPNKLKDIIYENIDKKLYNKLINIIKIMFNYKLQIYSNWILAKGIEEYQRISGMPSVNGNDKGDLIIIAYSHDLTKIAFLQILMGYQP